MDNFKEALTYDDVCLVPQFNNIPSRTEPTLKTWLTTKTEVEMPLIPANMDTVIGDDLADIIIENGGCPIFHRFTTLEQQLEWAKKYGDRCFISCGLNDLDSTVKILTETDCRGVCIDIAHAHSESMKNFMIELRKNIGDKEIIAGNVCTPMGYQDLVNWGADSVKVGIGAGAICSTRIVTGFGVSQFSAVYECSQIAKKLRVPIIADGGIRGSNDIAKALAGGASTIMAGGIFANTFESSAPKFDYEGETYMKYRGQASADFQKDFYGGVKKGTVPEGVDFKKKVTKSAQQIIDEMNGGLRSSFTYGGARNIKEFQRKAEFRTVRTSYNIESNPRPNQ